MPFAFAKIYGKANFGHLSERVKKYLICNKPTFLWMLNSLAVCEARFYACWKIHNFLIAFPGWSFCVPTFATKPSNLYLRSIWWIRCLKVLFERFWCRYGWLFFFFLQVFNNFCGFMWNARFLKECIKKHSKSHSQYKCNIFSQCFLETEALTWDLTYFCILKMSKFIATKIISTNKSSTLKTVISMELHLLNGCKKLPES